MVRPLRDFERLDPGLFRAFLAAAETLNFTRAAEKAGMTQSGVSQHISKLESLLDAPLFTRSNKSVLLTDAGKQLVLYIESYLDAMDEFCERLQSGERTLQGNVSYAMPSSCLLSPHLSEMLNKRKEFSGIELRILIRSNDEIVRGLLDGIYDFGFVTRTYDLPGLDLIPFCDEELVFVAPSGMEIKGLEIGDIVAAEFVTYPGIDVYFDLWQRHYFPKVKNRCFEALNVKGHIESIHGAITLVAGGTGCSVMPVHCIDKELAKQSILIHRPDVKKAPLLNRIHIATLAGRVATRRAQQVMDWFFAMHPEVER
ncbi:MAG: LysR family transcriptional regulator [Oligoflexales bacterium]